MRIYDVRGNLIEMANLGIDNEPINDKINEAYKTTIKYDDLGNRIETIKYNKDNEIIE